MGLRRKTRIQISFVFIVLRFLTDETFVRAWADDCNLFCQPSEFAVSDARTINESMLGSCGYHAPSYIFCDCNSHYNSMSSICEPGDVYISSTDINQTIYDFYKELSGPKILPGLGDTISGDFEDAATYSQQSWLSMSYIPPTLAQLYVLLSLVGLVLWAVMVVRGRDDQIDSLPSQQIAEVTVSRPASEMFRRFYYYGLVSSALGLVVFFLPYSYKKWHDNHSKH